MRNDLYIQGYFTNDQQRAGVREFVVILMDNRCDMEIVHTDYDEMHLEVDWPKELIREEIAKLQNPFQYKIVSYE